MPSTTQLKVLYQLSDLVQAAEPVDFELITGFMLRAIPDDLEIDEGPGRYVSLELIGDEVTQYRNALDLLCDDDLLEHLSKREIDAALWRLVCELVCRQSMREIRHRNLRIESFLDDLCRQWTEFEVIQEVDGFDPSVSGLDLGRVRLVKLTPTLLREWGLWERGILRPKWKGRTAATTITQAGSAERAAQRGQNRIGLALDELRFAIPAGIRAHISDRQLRFETGWWAVRSVSSGSTDVRRSYWGSSPQSGTRWGRVDTVRAIEFLAPIHRIRESGRKRLAERIERSLVWIGTSRAATSPRVALIASCAALEAVLSDKSAGKKGELLALRSILLPAALGKSFRDPGDLFELYELRSYLAHGSSVEATDEDAQNFASITSSLLADFAIFCDVRPSVRSFSDMLAQLETADALQSARKWIEERRPAGYKEIAKAADSQLNLLRERQ